MAVSASKSIPVFPHIPSLRTIITRHSKSKVPRMGSNLFVNGLFCAIVKVVPPISTQALLDPCSLHVEKQQIGLEYIPRPVDSTQCCCVSQLALSGSESSVGHFNVL